MSEEDEEAVSEDEDDRPEESPLTSLGAWRVARGVQGHDEDMQAFLLLPVIASTSSEISRHASRDFWFKECFGSKECSPLFRVRPVPMHPACGVGAEGAGGNRRFQRGSS